MTRYRKGSDREAEEQFDTTQIKKNVIKSTSLNHSFPHTFLLLPNVSPILFPLSFQKISMLYRTPSRFFFGCPCLPLLFGYTSASFSHSRAMRTQELFDSTKPQHILCLLETRPSLLLLLHGNTRQNPIKDSAFCNFSILLPLFGSCATIGGLTPSPVFACLIRRTRAQSTYFWLFIGGVSQSSVLLLVSQTPGT